MVEAVGTRVKGLFGQRLRQAACGQCLALSGALAGDCARRYTVGMEDLEFLRRIKERIQQGTGVSVELELSREERASVSVDFSTPVPRIVFGADALTYPGLARMFMQYAVLCLRERRKVSEEEFLRFLRRN
ncbi:MAG: hypothetical protein HY686_05965 [Chloroflexi bacterium]|nr:hypothetical protein [Chloroflexota bacterium]